MSNVARKNKPTFFFIIDGKVIGCNNRAPTKLEARQEQQIYSNNGQTFDVVAQDREVPYLVQHRNWVMGGKQMTTKSPWG